jgi:hypothetical protein
MKPKKKKPYKWVALLVLATALLIPACGMFTSKPKPLEVTGVSIVALGRSFVAISPVITKGCIDKVYTVQTCTDFRLFSDKFKEAHPVAEALWKSGVKFSDVVIQDSAERALQKLAADFTAYQALASGGK